MTRAILHVGLPKAGSTSLQLAVHRNRRPLREDFGLYSCPWPDDALNDYALHGLLVEGRMAEARRVLRGYAENAEAARCKAVLISCERFFEFGESPATLDPFIALLHEVFAGGVEGVIVLRALEPLLRSYILQQINNGGISFDKISLAAWFVRCTLAWWDAPIPMQAIGFEKSTAHGGLSETCLWRITGEITGIRDETANRTPNVPLAVAAGAGVAARLAAIRLDEDINADAVDVVRQETRAALPPDSAAALAAVEALIETELQAYLDATLRHLPPDMRRRYEQLQTRPWTANRI